MDVKTWFFYISLGLFILQFSPFNFLLASQFFLFAYFAASAYIIVFAIFVVVENYEKIKYAMIKAQTKSTNFIVFKNSNPKKDLVRFILISLLIAFCLDVILTKLADQPIVEYISKYVPGLPEFKDLTNLSITESLKKTITRSQNITGNQGVTGITGLMNVKIGAIKGIAALLIGPTIGPIILFLLRQISYKKRRSNKRENPGARILVFFIVGTMILLVIDIYTDSSNGFSSLFQNSETLVDNESKDNKILVYSVRNIGAYFASFAPNPSYWVTVISIWAFDWYLFSRIWSKDYITGW